MGNVLYCAMTSLMFTFLVMPLFVKLLQRLHVMDKGGRRKIHKGTIPSMGGAVMFAGFLCALLLWLPEGFALEPYRSYTAALALMALMGIRDDMVPVSPLIKLLVQLLAASLVVATVDIRLLSFHGLFGVEMLPEWLGYSLGVLFIVFVTNAFNLADGIDGLAGFMAFSVLSFLALWNFWLGNVIWAAYLACYAGALLAFLYYNWQPASIFMGDTGSLTIGFLLAISTLHFINTNGTLPDYSPYKFHAVLSAGVVMVLVPVFDTTRVFFLRLLQRRSPFKPDKQHTHHALLRKGLDHAKATLLIMAVYLLIAIPVLLLSWKNLAPDWVLLSAMLAGLVLIDRYLYYQLTHLHR